MDKRTFQTGFTVLELLVVIAVIGILAGTLISTSIGGTLQARDARRIQELYQIAHALQQYYTVYEQYPDNTDIGDIGCWWDWDAGSILNGEGDSFLQPLKDEGFLTIIPIERNLTGDSTWEQCSYRYVRADGACGCPGTWAVLYATCETNKCPVGERPECCTEIWSEGAGDWDARDITIFLKER